MIFPNSPLVLCVALAATILPQQVSAQECPSTWTCAPTSAPPTIDSDLSEWANVEGISSPIIMITGEEYPQGNAEYKCMYDDTHIFFALEIPGDYRHNTTDNHKCAAIATMLKIGSSATFVNMGGCPDAMGGCADGVPDSCMDYRVDIGAHWELSGADQAFKYPISVAAEGDSVTARSGNDPLSSNKDDEYAVSSYCRFDDDDADAGNEWAGAWAHTNPVIGESGNYIFELSRLLKTDSTLTDKQLEAGGMYQFGVAFWDPFELETGWSDIGHYITGCANKWIDLELVTASSASKDASTTSGAFSSAAAPLFVILTAIAALF
jgi:hypothetical protein